MHGNECLVIPLPHYGNLSLSTYITKNRSEQAFHLGFRHVKYMIRQQLQRISSIKRDWSAKDHAVTIIVAGGSTRHAEFKKWMEELCAEQGLPKAITLETMAQFCG